MTIELYLVKPGEMTEIPTESITWSGQRYKAARKLMADILYTDIGGHQYTRVEEGDTVLFKWQGTELFRGTIFSRSQSKNGKLSLVAYDMLQYLLVNRDVYVFSKKRADEIILRLCKDFEIPYGAIANTGTILNEIHQNETSLYDIALNALVNTEKKNGRRFQMVSRQGKLTVEEWKPSSDMWVIETGVNLIDYNLSTSIEETATRVKMTSGEDKKAISVTVSDADGKKRYGVLQHFERVSEDVSKAELTKRANTALQEKKGAKKELEITALGIGEVISGRPIHVIENEIDTKGTFYVDEDTHYFKGQYHDMRLKLIEKNTMAVI